MPTETWLDQAISRQSGSAVRYRLKPRSVWLPMEATPYSRGPVWRRAFLEAIIESIEPRLNPSRIRRGRRRLAAMKDAVNPGT
jgi:hypothetical protein